MPYGEGNHWVGLAAVRYWWAGLKIETSPGVIT